MEEQGIWRRFLLESGVWEGSLNNYVNREGGLVQQGTNRMLVEIQDDGSIQVRNQLFNSQGKKTDYEGFMHVKVEGNRLMNQKPLEQDPNTSNPINNYNFQGYIALKHIYIYEEYDEVLPEGNVENRRNSMHYYFPQENEIISIADVYVNGQLLVFGTSHFYRQEDG